MSSVNYAKRDKITLNGVACHFKQNVIKSVSRSFGVDICFQMPKISYIFSFMSIFLIVIYRTSKNISN